MRRLLAVTLVVGVLFIGTSGCDSSATCASASCNGTCVNLDLDPSNCGTCGLACANGACAGGGCVIAADEHPESDLIVAGDELVFVESSTVVAFSTTGAMPRIVLTNVASEIGVAGGRVFWTRSSGAGAPPLFSASLAATTDAKSGGAAVALPDTHTNPVVTVLGATGPEVFVLYQADGTGSGVYSLDATDSKAVWKLEVPIDSATIGLVTPGALLRAFPTSTDLWFTLSQTLAPFASLYHCKRGACAPQRIGSGAVLGYNPVRASAVGSDLYWLESDDARAPPGEDVVELYHAGPDGEERSIAVFAKLACEKSAYDGNCFGQGTMGLTTTSDGRIYSNVGGTLRVSAAATSSATAIPDGNALPTVTSDVRSECNIAADANSLYYCVRRQVDKDWTVNDTAVNGSDDTPSPFVIVARAR